MPDMTRGGEWPKHLQPLNEWLHLHGVMEKLRLHCPEFSETSKNGFTESLKHLALSVQKLRKISHRHPEGPQPRDGRGQGGCRGRPDRPAAKWARSWVRRVNQEGNSGHWLLL